MLGGGRFQNTSHLGSCFQKSASSAINRAAVACRREGITFRQTPRESEVSEYQLTRALPREFKSSLPSVEEIERELSKA